MCTLFLQLPIKKLLRPAVNFQEFVKPTAFMRFNQHASKRQKKAAKSSSEGSAEDVLSYDVKQLLQQVENGRPASNNISTVHSASDPVDSAALPERFSEIEVTVADISSTGDGIGFADETKRHVYVVPFTVPGDRVKAKVVHHVPAANNSLTDLVEVLKPGPERKDDLIKCQYFGKCAGCQFQMLPYDVQLRHKKRIVEKAYKNFSSLPPELVPAVQDTIGSPMQYGYRTKLTPHFDGPPGSNSRKRRRDPVPLVFDEVPPIGFMMKGRQKTMDIEDCPIGTDAVREGMKAERKRVIENIKSYRKGATLLLRESTTRAPKQAEESVKPMGSSSRAGQLPVEKKNLSLDEGQDESAVSVDADNHGEPQSTEEAGKAQETQSHESPTNVDERTEPAYIETKTCVTDSNATATEYIDSYTFKNTAGAFFQNNNSILPRFTAYIRDSLRSDEAVSTSAPSSPLSSSESPSTPRLKYLIDAYCGSGLFTITLSSLFTASTGIDIADTSITAARINASTNKIPNATFITADASNLFSQITYPSDKTAVIIDPPRKGCDTAFLDQLLRFGPQTIVYVSCNVHTQARDVGVLVRGAEGGRDARYEIKSLRGFDFFPQTGHVEGVAILEKCAEVENASGNV